MLYEVNGQFSKRSLNIVKRNVMSINFAFIGFQVRNSKSEKCKTCTKKCCLKDNSFISILYIYVVGGL